ncbi:MAG: hypothetical protein M1826_001980 [Phylliscum demangeonii]|nr:MAG: hypothetical protein M1826_001980 [Phylliscum demangeonii]
MTTAAATTTTTVTMPSPSMAPSMRPRSVEPFPQWSSPEEGSSFLIESTFPRHSTSSLDSRAMERHDPIPEEDEESSSEPFEPLTPTSDAHPVDVHQQDVVGTVDDHSDMTPRAHVIAVKPLDMTPHPPDHARTPAVRRDAPKSGPALVGPVPPIQRRSTLKRISSLFNRTHPPSTAPPAEGTSAGETAGTASVPPPLPPAAPPPSRLSSFSRSVRNSPRPSTSNTPPSPTSPLTTMLADQSSSSVRSDGAPRPLQTRTSSALLLGEKMGRIRFHAAKPGRPPRPRSTSMTGASTVVPDNSISMYAAAGVGLKARRLSTSLPDDFTVDTIELSEEFVSTSVVPGRRGKMVGSGATACVKLMARKGQRSEVVYAVKEYRRRAKQEDVAEYEKKVKSEYSIAKSLHHPNIVQSVRLCTHQGRWNHVMEYCPPGELFSLVRRDYLKEADRMCLFKQLLRGVAYLHAHGIAHRDIKLENLLLTNEGYVKITDFGVSDVFSGEHPGLRSAMGQCGRKMGENRRCAPGICGSLPYIAPEVLAKQGDYDPRALDVWSCALVYLFMRFKGAPWAAADPNYGQYGKFRRGWQTFLDAHPAQLITDDSGLPACGEVFRAVEPVALQRLLLRMMHPTPEKRIGAQDALDDRWIKKIECCAPEAADGGGDGSGSGGAPECTFDVRDAKTCRLAGKHGIRKSHNHLPPAPTKRLLMHSFDFRDA